MPAVPTIGLDSLDVNLLFSRNIPQGKIILGGTWTAITINTTNFPPNFQGCNKLFVMAGVDTNPNAYIEIQIPNYDQSASVIYILKAGESVFINTNWETLNSGQIQAGCVNYATDAICSYIFFQ